MQRCEQQRLPRRYKVVLAAEILASYMSVRWRVERDSLPAVMAAVRDRRAAPRTSVAAAGLTATRLGSATGRVLRLLPTDSRCLMQSLVLSRLLAARGISSVLVIGAHSHSDFTAHAWVEVDGLPVLPTRGFEEARLLEI